MRGVVVTLLLVAGCHAVPADDPGAWGEQRWVASDATVGVEFLSPPWSVVTDETDRLELEVPSEVFGLSIDESSPSHAFQLGHVDMLESLQAYTDAEEDVGETGGIDEAVIEDIPELPDTLVGVDLRDPYAVARAELDLLIDDKDAQLDFGVSAFDMPTGASAVEFQVQLSPGFFLRAFYIDARPTLVRATFVSLFDLDTDDVSAMARSIDTVDPEGP